HAEVLGSTSAPDCVRNPCRGLHVLRLSTSPGSVPVNTANLQLEGLYLAIASINNVLVKKGILTRDEVDLALRRAEQTAIGDDRMVQDMRASNRDAVAFPAR